jgi:pyruvate dehydrogenase (quinone)
MSTVAELLIKALADYGVRSVWGVVGDALNPVTDAIRREDRIEWIGVRHEEAGAFAASAQAQLTDSLGVCMGTVGPGAVHLLNGLYDAAKSHAPVLAIVGQVPREEIGSDFFQEVDNHAVFADVAVFNATLMDVDQLPMLLEQAVNTALAESGVAVLTIPGDVGGLDLPKHTRAPRFVPRATPGAAPAERIVEAVRHLEEAGKVTLLVGQGARPARAEVQELADRLAAPMVLSLKAKDGFDDENPFEIGQSGLIGNPATATAFDDCDVLLLLGTDFPYRNFYPQGKTVIQVDARGQHIGRRTPVDVGLVGDVAATVAAMLPSLSRKEDRQHLEHARHKYEAWRERQDHLTDPDYDQKPKGLLRKTVDNPDGRVRPELLAAAIDRHAPHDAVFTSDTGMSTVWLSRFVRMSGTRRLIGSYNLGSMANAMPQALGASALDRDRMAIAFCGDGGLSMLMGDLITAVSHELPVKLVVFDNGRLGMVKLEMEQVGLPEFGTVLHNPDFAKVAEAVGMRGIRVTDPHEVDDAVREALATEGPVLLDVLTNPDEIAVPPKPALGQMKGFAIAKSREFLDSPE